MTPELDAHGLAEASIQAHTFKLRKGSLWASLTIHPGSRRGSADVVTLPPFVVPPPVGLSHLPVQAPPHKEEGAVLQSLAAREALQVLLAAPG